MARIYLDNENKIVVEADKGIINSDGTTEVTLTEEQYTIGRDDLAVLMNIVNGMNVVDKSSCSIFHYGTLLVKVLSNEEMREEIKELKVLYDDLQKENKNLKSTITEHNENRRIFWKPIKID